jgi:hypothetical protein
VHALIVVLCRRANVFCHDRAEFICALVVVRRRHRARRPPPSGSGSGAVEAEGYRRMSESAGLFASSRFPDRLTRVLGSQLIA